MKKLKYLLLVLLFPVFASAYTGSYGMNVSECLAFSDLYKSIYGSYEYKYCYRAGCSTSGTWNIANMSSSSGYRCGNGNATPYTKWQSDGCSSFVGSCKVNQGVYCTKVLLVDCDKNKDGSSYINPTQSPVVTQTNTQSKTVTQTNTQSKTTNKTTKTRATSKSATSYTPITKGTTTDITRPNVYIDPAQTEPVETEPVLSNNLNINYITIEGVDLKYINGYDEYTIKVPYGKLDLDIFVSTEDDKTIAVINGAMNMPDSDTTIDIQVLAEDGSEKHITINVKRYTGESGDCNISNISLSDYELKDFDKNNYQYMLKVNRKTKSLYMDIVPSDPLHATVEVLGNNDLVNNSVVTINVKAENGTLCTYNITIKKSSGVWVPIVIVIIVTAVLLLIGYLVYRFIKRSRDTYQYE